MPTPSRIARSLTTPKVALIAFVFLLVTKWPVLDQPPVWDGSKTVFPAAITLAHHDFDIAHLLRQPSYFQGGPNTHGLSLVTWVTALAYWTLGDRPEVILPLLHLLHLAGAAGALALLWGIGRRSLGPSLALGTAATVAVFPIFFVQAGYVYLEMPILAFSAAAIHAWLRGRHGQAAAWATASALVKPSGSIVTGALFLATFLSTRDLRKNWKRLLGRGCILAAGPLLVAVGQFALRPKGVYGVGSFNATVAYLRAIPDMALLLVAFVAASIWVRPWSLTTWPDADDALPAQDEVCDQGPRPGPAKLYWVCAAMMVSFFSFYLALVPLGSSVPILTRYYLQLFPFLLIGLALLVATRSRRAVVGILVVAALFFVANRRGHFYPDRDTTNFAITERSMAYLDLVQLQNAGLEELVKSADVPVFYGLSESFRLDYPQMGFDLARPARGHCIYNEMPYMAVRLQDFPPSFAMLFDYPWLGGRQARDVLQQAEEHLDYETKIAVLNVGRFESYLAYVRHVDAPWPRAVQPDAAPDPDAKMRP